MNQFFLYPGSTFTFVSSYSCDDGLSTAVNRSSTALIIQGALQGLSLAAQREFAGTAVSVSLIQLGVDVIKGVCLP